MGSVGQQKNQNNIINQWLGAPGKDLWELNSNNMSEAIKSINPHWGEGKEWRENCALCSTAAILSMMGYDVEAAPRDKVWRGFDNVFEFDWKNHDNFVAPGSAKINYSGTDYIESLRNSNKFISKSTDKVAEQIESTMQNWGLHSAAVLNVAWKNSNKSHAVVVYQEKYYTTIMDFQTHTTYSGDAAIKRFMKKVKPTQTGLYRLDNAQVKANIPDIEKIVRKKQR